MWGRTWSAPVEAGGSPRKTRRGREAPRERQGVAITSPDMAAGRPNPIPPGRRRATTRPSAGSRTARRSPRRCTNRNQPGWPGGAGGDRASLSEGNETVPVLGPVGSGERAQGRAEGGDADAPWAGGAVVVARYRLAAAPDVGSATATTSSPSVLLWGPVEADVHDGPAVCRQGRSRPAMSTARAVGPTPAPRPRGCPPLVTREGPRRAAGPFEVVRRPALSASAWRAFRRPGGSPRGPPGAAIRAGRSPRGPC
ncbi:hypothetical protein QFZ22_004779 [Streptomyces canus]|uniref:Uncharacterized protein n=1 Tax=Streptomyces canus TaxID=58343 RepID=A0AAW8FFG8_9ACTN|nr:hypothetical protein [Streptomyces canus]